ncbi:MAG: GWxTD domain-containing protein [Gemmatimonadota bacterium]
MLRSLAAALVLVSLLAAPAAGQGDVTDLFDQDPLYERAGVLRGKGEIPFFADLSFLRGTADSTQTLLGVGLSNSTFQFVKAGEGYRATYEVGVRLRSASGSFENEWRETVRAGSFDETLLGRETVVFQTRFGLLPGTYRLELEVRDAQSGESSEVESEIEVPRVGVPGAGWAISNPVLLRSFEPAAAPGPREHVLYPSHYYATAPEELPFFVEVYRGDGAAAASRLAVTLAPDEGGAAVSSVTLDLPAAEEGVSRVYGRVPGRGMKAGVYRLAATLQDASGATLGQSSTKVSVSAVAQWVEQHWEEAVELLAYEATDDEREALEATPPDGRVRAWNEFWEVRDPVPATPANEAFESYFRRIAAANASFGTQLRPGWKSDRGRVYVAFGAPNDVIRRPLQSGAFPVEIWVYDASGFQIAFEDRIGFGNYQIVNPGTFSNELAALERRKHRAIAERREQREAREAGNETPADPEERDGSGGSAPADSSGTA